MTKNLLERVESHLAAGDRLAAQALLKEYLQGYPRDDHAWVLLAHAVDSNSQMIFCLTQARKINPQNAQAQALLKVLKGVEPPEEGDSQLKPGPAKPDEDGVPSETGAEEDEEEDPNALIDPQVTARIGELFEGIRGGVEPSRPYGRAGQSGQASRRVQAPDASGWIDEQDMADLRYAPLEVLWNWECDPEARYISCSSEVEQALGIQPDEFLGQELYSFSVGEKSRLAIMYHLQADIMPVEVPVHFLNAARQLVPVSLHLEKTEQDGITTGYHGVARIITQAADFQPEAGEGVTGGQVGVGTGMKPGRSGQPEAVCPFLDRVETLPEAADAGGVRSKCSRPKQALPVSETYQQAYCASTAYTRCQVYRQGLRWPQPSIINQSALEKSRRQRQWYFLLALGLVMILAVIVLGALILTTL